ncbi:MAG: purine-binding chemotaxis protein CheW [Clostridia bacterium]|nr:purine-binding chemotaxis protein CheW [Clostridia bacterium]
MAEKQYVVFKLGNEKYCADIVNVGSITEFDTITKVPNTPSYIEGVINLRGEVIPIVSLKKRFNVTESQGLQDARIIIITHDGKNVGFLVDDASQVIRIDDENIEPTPAIIAGEDRKYISGVGKVDGAIVVLLDLIKILSDSELEALDAIDKTSL